MQFEMELLRLNQPLAKLQDKYRGALAKQKTAYQADGQLEAMMAVGAELKPWRAVVMKHSPLTPP